MNKTILVTGSSRGVGKAIAKLAHEKGYRVIVHGKRIRLNYKKSTLNYRIR